MNKNKIPVGAPALCVTLFDNENIPVPQLSKFPATPDHVIAALHFLDKGCTLEVCIKDYTDEENS